jgi:hypothetical protein
MIILPCQDDDSRIHITREALSLQSLVQEREVRTEEP